VRGLNAQLATISTESAAPVIAATRLRRGNRNSGHGAARMLANAVATARRCGATGEVLVRADSAYFSSAVVAAIREARFSLASAPDSPQRRSSVAVEPGYGLCRTDDAHTRVAAERLAESRGWRGTGTS
jgi:hypothetical protein